MVLWGVCGGPRRGGRGPAGHQGHNAWKHCSGMEWPGTGQRGTAPCEEHGFCPEANRALQRHTAEFTRRSPVQGAMGASVTEGEDRPADVVPWRRPCHRKLEALLQCSERLVFNVTSGSCILRVLLTHSSCWPQACSDHCPLGGMGVLSLRGWGSPRGSGTSARAEATCSPAHSRHLICTSWLQEYN